MTEWRTLRARLPDDEFSEVERIRERYGLSYNEIMRSGVKFYVSLTLAKELIADSLAKRDITVRGRNLGDILNSLEYQADMEQRITRIVKLLVWEIFEKGMDFEKRTRPLRKKRAVGRPKEKKAKG